MPLLFGSMGLGYLVMPVAFIVIDSQLVNVTDEHEYRTGQRAEGVVFSIRPFAVKATSGVGGLLAGFGLEFLEFPKGAKIEDLTPEILDELLFMNRPLYLFICFYYLTEQRNDAMMDTLTARR